MKWVKNIKWSLKKKIFAGYGIVLILLLVVLGWSLVHISRLGRASDAILSENYKSILAAENMINALERQDSAILFLLHGKVEESVKQYRNNEMIFMEWFGRAKDNITIAGEDSIIYQIENEYKNYLVQFMILKDAYENEKATITELMEVLYGKLQITTFHALYNSCINLRELNQATMFKASDNAARLARHAMISMTLIGLLTIAVGVGFSLFLANFITQPIRQLIVGTHEIAEGNYTVNIPKRSTDEFGLLADDFNTMTEKLKSYHDLNFERLMSERRKSDAIISSIDEGLVFVDADFKIANINPAAAKIFNVDIHSAEERHFLEIVKQPILFDYIKNASETGKLPAIETDENILTIKHNENIKYYQFYITPVRTKDDISKGVVLLLRDITRLKELDLLKSQFVMTASHELRTPLTSSIMSIDLLVEHSLEILDEKDRELLNAAQEELHRLRFLVNDLLELSKIESGKIELVFDNVIMSDLAAKAVSVLNTQANENGIDLIVDMPQNLPAVRIDPNKITWVITNLVSNAFRYTPRGGYVKLTAEPVGNQIQVSVTDNGSGIPYEYQSRIFDKFVQVKTNHVSGGSGLGLAICKEIVRAHKGTIWVDSVPEEGSTFNFTLPVTEPLHS
ncbi:MAG: HAMP domain-containing protein [Candidatus Latescibacteria bacterium]|nr:HAMP domain-containing protein [Candidatus Latescibacterota bacterium]